MLCAEDFLGRYVWFNRTTEVAEYNREGRTYLKKKQGLNRNG
jgi:hypothetical protein